MLRRLLAMAALPLALASAAAAGGPWELVQCSGFAPVQVDCDLGEHDFQRFFFMGPDYSMCRDVASPAAPVFRLLPHVRELNEPCFAGVLEMVATDGVASYRVTCRVFEAPLLPDSREEFSCEEGGALPAGMASVTCAVYPWPDWDLDGLPPLGQWACHLILRA